MAHEFDVIVERDSEGYYVASVPALPCCHTQAKSLDELMGRRAAQRLAPLGRAIRGPTPPSFNLGGFPAP